LQRLRQHILSLLPCSDRSRTASSRSTRTEKRQRALPQSAQG
jgi:hypothetical protein